jgi:hypothetical protein
MPTINDRVTLTDEEVDTLEALLRKGKRGARQQTRARILLKAAAPISPCADVQSPGIPHGDCIDGIRSVYPCPRLADGSWCRRSRRRAESVRP